MQNAVKAVSARVKDGQLEVAFSIGKFDCRRRLERNAHGSI